MATLKNTVISDTGYLKLASGTAAQRVGSTASETRYNTDTGYNLFETYASTGWHNLSPYGLSVYSVTPVSGVTYITGTGLQINPAISGIIQINGFNFTPDTQVFLDSTQITSGVVVTNPKLITITTGTSFSVSSGSYSNIVVKNGGIGQSVTFAYPITVVGGPQFSTATILGTFAEGTISTSVAATSPGATVTYSANSTAGNGGSGYGLPSGLSINSTTGAITGTLVVNGTTTYNITIKATDNNATPRTASKDFVLYVTDSGNPIITGPSAGNITTLNYSTDTLASTVAPTNNTITTFTATDPVGSSVYYRVTSGVLPNGVSLNSSTGVLSGSYIIGGKQSATQTFNFGVTAVDANGNASAEKQYNIIVNTPYFYRQILTTGYALGGYASGTPWKNVNRIIMATELSVNLGDQLTYAHNYKSSACSADKQYSFGCGATGANGNGSYQDAGYGYITAGFNMRTEVGFTGTSVTYGSRGQAGVMVGNDGSQSAAYISGGFTGTNSNIIEKYTFATDGVAVLSGQTTTTTNLGEGWYSSTDGYGVLQGGTGFGTAASYRTAFTYSTEQLSSWGVYLSASCQQKFLHSKLNRVYGGNGGTYGNTGGTAFTKTIWSTQEQFTCDKGYGKGLTGTGTAASCGEETWIMGQDFGWAVGVYDGSQNNNAIRFYYSTDTGADANTGLSRKGVAGASSGAGAWRD
jgi:hypothetical protein